MNAKSLFDSVWELFAWYIAALIIVGIAVAKIEGWTLDVGFWWAAVTGEATGYGDYAPKTLPGRVLAVILMIFSTKFVAPLLGAVMAAKLIVDSDAFTHHEQEKLQSDLNAIKTHLGIETDK